MVLVGCKPQGRFTEQHDMFFGIAPTLKDLLPAIGMFWWDAGQIHIDVWREVTVVDGKAINVVPLETPIEPFEQEKIFFLNLGGYKEGDFEEYHYKMLCLGKDKGEAIAKAKETAFYKHTGFAGANSHIDDKYGVDVDDIYEISDVLSQYMKKKYRIQVTDVKSDEKDIFHAGYLKLSKIK